MGENAYLDVETFRVKSTSKDVGDLYCDINSEGFDKDKFLEVVSVGVDLGHPGVIFYACSKSGAKISTGAVYNALNNALGLRGWDISNPNIAVGELYQTLYSRDFEQISSKTPVFDEDGKPVMEGEEQKVEVTPYAHFHPVEKIMIQFALLDQKGFDIRDKLIASRNSIKSKGRMLSLEDSFFVDATDLFFSRFPLSTEESEH